MKANNGDGAPGPDQVYSKIQDYVAHWNMAPTIRELATELDCGHSTVQRAIEKLEKDGSIKVHKRRSRGIVLKGRTRRAAQ
jgi:DNA-binding transcriptional regulator YhcF (GntR family)